MNTKATFSFGRADLAQATDNASFIDLNHAYFGWMNDEISNRCGFSIPEIVNTTLGNYVLHTANIASAIAPQDGGVYFLREPGGLPIAMGGLRRLPDGAAEIVRIYTRPERRGLGLGRRMVAELIGIAKALGYATLRLDTAVFMESAQRIYEAAGFLPRAPYPGAEPPPQLQPYWLYYERGL